MNPNLWTPEQVETMLRLDCEGKSAAEIAAVVGRSRAAVLGRLHRMRAAGLGPPKKPPSGPRSAEKPIPKEARTYMRGAPSAPRRIRAAVVEKSEEVRAKAENCGPGVHVFNADLRQPWRVPKAEAFQPLPGTEPVPLIGRPAFTCAWVVEGEGADALCCGERVGTGAYCPDHRRLAYLPTAKLNPRDLRRYA